MNMLWGAISLPWWGYIIVTLILTHITIVSVTVYLHRHQAHQALEMHPVLSHFFRLWLWLTTGMQTRAWVAIHRKHHAKVETEGDPHSPQVFGIRKVLWTGAELYREEAENKQTSRDYGQGTPDDWLERNVYTPGKNYGIFLLLAIKVILFGIPGISMWAIQMVWIPLLAAGVINGLGHWWGYRNFETPDASTNLMPWGLVIGGEELHNNHHAFANSAKFSSRRWEFDIGWFYIRLFQALGLAQVQRVAPQPIVDQGKEVIDMDTLMAIVLNHFNVLAQYSREVVSKVHREEMRKADATGRTALRHAGKLISRDRSKLDQPSRKRLQELLQNNEILQAVYQYKERLQSTLHQAQRMRSKEKLLEQLRDWCHQAETTRIQALVDFSVHLRSYTLIAPTSS